MKKRILVLIASRANFGRLVSVMKAIQKHPDLELQLVVGASALLDRFGCMEVIQADGWRVDQRIYTVVDGDTPGCMATTTGLFTVQMVNALEKLNPHCVVLHGDRYELLAAATAAAYMNIPIAHTEGGETTGSIDDKVRRAITQLSDFHFATTKRAAAAVMMERRGRTENCYVVGSTALDPLSDLDLSIPEGMLEQYRGVGPIPDLNKPYLVALQHPVTTEYGKADEETLQVLQAVMLSNLPTVWLWPNVDAGSEHVSGVLRRFREEEGELPFHFVKNLSVSDYARLLYNSACFVGNSSSGIKEGSFLGVPYVCTSSRQKGREIGMNVRFVECKSWVISREIEKAVNDRRPVRSTKFGDGTAGQKMVEILAKEVP